MSWNPNHSKLDFNEIIQQVFDDVNNRLRVDTSATVVVNSVQVDISHTDDSIRLGDGTDLVTTTNVGGNIGLDVNLINTSIPVVIVPSSLVREVKNTYNEITSTPSASETTIVTYTAPIGKTTYLLSAESSGTNIARYTISVNGVKLARDYTYFSGPFDSNFDFRTGFSEFPGYELLPGDVVTIKVLHSRSGTGDFNGTIKTLEEV